MSGEFYTIQTHTLYKKPERVARVSGQGGLAMLLEYIHLNKALISS